MLTLLTATGARPDAWAICERLMAAQDYAGPVRWVIVDDGPDAQPVAFRRDGWSLEVVRPTPRWQPGKNTQARNLSAGLAVIGPGERVVIVEDDDWYGPGYLSAAARWLESADLAGESHARYYNVATGRGKQLGNAAHASLCSSVVKGAGLVALRRAVETRVEYIDMELWRRFRGTLHATRHVVGIKGMPGRGGIGAGHKRTFGSPMALSDWIGDDARLYQ